MEAVFAISLNNQADSDSWLNGEQFGIRRNIPRNTQSVGSSIGGPWHEYEQSAAVVDLVFSCSNQV